MVVTGSRPPGMGEYGQNAPHSCWEYVMPLIFVHGITVRRDRFDRLLESVVDGFSGAGCTLPVSGCYWGDLGRSSAYTGVTIPGFSGDVRAIGELGVVSGLEALLTLLLEDPLAELADLRDAEELGLETAGFRPFPPEVIQRSDALRAAEGPVNSRLAGSATNFAGLASPLDADKVADLVHKVFTAAAQADRGLDTVVLCGPMARAITAGLCREVVGVDGLSSEFRWNVAAVEVQGALNDQLGGHRGIFSEVGSRALTVALRRGLRNRIMPAVSLFLGDVLAWFRNREEILNRVHTVVEAAGTDGPLVLLGHSLGGVIAFEYCATSGRNIDLLATVGSQVGWFGEMGVLRSSVVSGARKHALPPELHAWHNLYDPDDALSFLAAPVFGAVKDIELDTRAPFPISHSEYWNLPDTYEKLTAAVMTR